jgi:hypothetical protein
VNWFFFELLALVISYEFFFDALRSHVGRSSSEVALSDAVQTGPGLVHVGGLLDEKHRFAQNPLVSELPCRHQLVDIPPASKPAGIKRCLVKSRWPILLDECRYLPPEKIEHLQAHPAVGRELIAVLGLKGLG